MNLVIMSGRLTKDIELKQSKAGKPFVKFSIAVDKYSKDKEKSVKYFDCVAFGHNANFLNKYAKKGDKVVISGELDNYTVEADDGSKKVYWTIMVNEIELCNKPTDNSNDSAAYGFEV